LDFKVPNSYTAPNCYMSNSAQDGGGARQTWISFNTTGTEGIIVQTVDYYTQYQGVSDDFVTVPLGIYSQGVWHHLEVKLIFDAVNNGQGAGGGPMDEVYYYIDGELIHVGPSWELFYEDVYYQYDVHLQGVPVQDILWRLEAPDGGEAGCLGEGILWDNYVQILDSSPPPCLVVGELSSNLRRVNGGNDLDVTEVLGLSLEVEYSRPANISKNLILFASSQQTVQCILSYPLDQLSPGIYSNCYTYTPGLGDNGSPADTGYLICSFTLTPILHINNTHGFGIYSAKILFKPIGSAGTSFDLNVECSIPSNLPCLGIATATLPITITNTTEQFGCDNPLEDCCGADAFIIRQNGEPQFVVEAQPGDVYACTDKEGDFQNLCSFFAALENS